jgi:hypothetical protein
MKELISHSITLGGVLKIPENLFGKFLNTFWIAWKWGLTHKDADKVAIYDDAIGKMMKFGDGTNSSTKNSTLAQCIGTLRHLRLAQSITFRLFSS